MEVAAAIVVLGAIALGVAFWAVGRRAALRERLKQTENAHDLRERQGEDLRDERGGLADRLDELVQDNSDDQA